MSINPLFMFLIWKLITNMKSKNFLMIHLSTSMKIESESELDLWTALSSCLRAFDRKEKWKEGEG